MLYASLQQAQKDGSNPDILAHAVKQLLTSLEEDRCPSVLWAVTYVQRFWRSNDQGRSAGDAGSASTADNYSRSHVVLLPPVSADLCFEDEVLDCVKQSWMTITGEAEAAFMRFDARDSAGEGEAFD